MLKKLSIKNIALISDLSIDLDKGLSVFSGETGAGKSLVIDSISLMLGLRADKSLITTGEEFASVTAVFELDEESSALKYIKEFGVEVDNTVIINRKIFTNGKNECRVNGFPFTLSMLRGFTSKIMDLHGQFEHQALLKQTNHLTILDNFKPDLLFATKQEIQKLYLERKNIVAQFAEFSGTDEERERTIDLLKYQIEEIEDLAPKSGEDEELKEARIKIINSEKILNALKNSLDSLDGSMYSSVESTISDSISSLSSVSGYDFKIKEQQDRLLEIKYEISDIIEELKSLREDCVFDESEADRIESRLDKIKLLHKKYGNTIDDIWSFCSEAKEKLKKLTSSTEIIENLKKQKSIIEEKLLRLFKELSEKRKKIANSFESAIIKELSDLGMSSSHFVVNFETKENTFSVNGFDDVEFLISTNTGEPVKSLSKIISGGEMSRFMLAIKNITAKIEGINTMIFDEIDSGISGKMGRKVAEKLAVISREHQVICVSHLPQIAAMADANYLISKSEKNGKTNTFVDLLNQTEKIKEVARLSGGDTESEKALLHSMEIVENCTTFKNSL